MALRGGEPPSSGVSSASFPWRHLWWRQPPPGQRYGATPRSADAPRHVGWEGGRHAKEGERTILSWAVTFLVIALIAAVLGFGGIAGAAAGIAKILFFVFLIVFVVSLIMGLRTRGGTRV